jgi:hypothetical protein
MKAVPRRMLLLGGGPSRWRRRSVASAAKSRSSSAFRICSPARPRRSVRRRALTVSSFLRLVCQAAQPGHFPQCDAAALPFDRLTHGQALVVGHRQQRAAGAQLRVADCSVEFTERGQDLYR